MVRPNVPATMPIDADAVRDIENPERFGPNWRGVACYTFLGFAVFGLTAYRERARVERDPQ